MNLPGSCLLMERDDVKSQITTMMICGRRNENKSLIIQCHNRDVSYPDVSLSMTIGTS